MKIFNNAIDLDKFKFVENVRNEVRKELGIEDKFVIGHVGRFCYQKNQEFLIDVFAEVYKQNTNAVLLLIGEGEDKKKIQQKVADMKLKNVMFLGNRNDVYRLYNAMDVFVLPSRYEGLPVVGVEAQANGLPCLLSDKMIKETKMTESAEFLSVEDGFAKWAEKIKSFMDFKRNSVYIEKFDISTQCSKLELFYNKLIKGAVKIYEERQNSKCYNGI